MRVETATRVKGSALNMQASNGEVIQTLVYNDGSAVFSEFSEFGNRGWVNAYLDELSISTIIKSLPELPMPNFADTDSRAVRTVKAIDSEWKQPCVYLCFYINFNSTPTTGATTSNKGNWTYKGKVALLHPYGYPDRAYRAFDFFTDNVSRKLPEGARLGVGFQWAEKLFYQTLSNVSYSLDEELAIPISTFNEVLPVTALNYSVVGYRTISGEPLPIEPVTTIVGRNLTTVFDAEVQVFPNTIKAIIRENGSVQQLDSTDTVDIDCSWNQQVISLQPDYTPTPVIVTGTVSQVVRQVDTRTFNATTTRQNAFSSQPTRSIGRITNNGATNVVYFKYGSDVTVAGGLIPVGTNPSSVSGGYSGSIAVNGGFMDLPSGYTGVVSVVTNAGVSSITTTETYTVAA